MTSDFLTQIENYWPALANGAATFAFPFISELRKDWIHPSKAAGTISNIISGIAAAAALLYINLERHSLHIVVAALPHWFVLIILGVALLFIQQLLIRWLRAGNLRQFGSIVVYSAGIVVLTFGFNLPIASGLIYLPVGGAMHCQGIGAVDLTTESNDAASSIAQSPVDPGSQRYEFLLLPEEKHQGLYVTADGRDSRIVEADDEPETALDLCTGN